MGETWNPGTFRVRVERDTAPDAEDHGGWKVVERYRGKVTLHFRGDIAECQCEAERLVEDNAQFGVGA